MLEITKKLVKRKSNATNCKSKVLTKKTSFSAFQDTTSAKNSLATSRLQHMEKLDNLRRALYNEKSLSTN